MCNDTPTDVTVHINSTTVSDTNDVVLSTNNDSLQFLLVLNLIFLIYNFVIRPIIFRVERLVVMPPFGRSTLVVAGFGLRWLAMCWSLGNFPVSVRFGL